ncbi:MAG: hypothetical protein KKE20_07040 [Nanoarchaeota archaeon]|nr:hypothetical protein [Nanoarchaeota archaeon]
MQLALNLISEKRILELIKASEEDEDDSSKEEEEEEIIHNSPECLDIDNETVKELEHRISQSHENQSKNMSKSSIKDNDLSKDRTIKEIVDKLNKKFNRKQKSPKTGQSRTEYLKQEFFNKSQYGIDISELFGYLNTKSTTDIYKAFYNQAKDNVYNFDDEMLSKEQQEKIVKMTKLARYMGYQGNTEYCTHESIDAHTKEKWALIRNICFVHTLTMLRYEMSLS